MKLVSQRLTLPVILGVSLTGVGIAMLYLLYKKDEEDANSHRNRVQIPKRITIEYKVPRQFVPAVIGRGGATVKDVQNKTGTQIHFKEDNIECPDRICIIRGPPEATQLAEKMIQSIIENQPIIETYETFVPQKTCGRIIGKGGEVIQHIQTTSGAKLIVESSFGSYNPNANRRIIIKGTAEQIAAALSQIEEKVQEEKELRTKMEASSTTRLPRGKLSPRNTAVNTTEPMQSTESLSLSVSDGIMEVYVSAMENPSQFWVQVLPKATALDQLVSEMTAYYNETDNHELHLLENITVGEMVAAKFSFDEKWYRAEVVSAPKDGKCEVYFLDYGDHEMVEINYVLELRTDFLSLRLQAIECSLANVKPRENEWSADACEKFADLTNVGCWKLLVAKVKGYKERALAYGRSRREGSPIPCVDLFDKNDDRDVNIGQELINEGLAEPEEGLSSAASSTLSLSTRSHEVPTFSSPVSSSPLARRTFSPETPANISLQTDSIVSIDRTEEIDLVTPKKATEPIEMVDLVTPDRKNLRNGNSNNQHNAASNSAMKLDKRLRIAPAGYESDVSDDCDDLELG